MGKAVKTFLIFVGVWCIASLLNGVLCGVCLTFIGTHNYLDAPGIVLLSIVLSFAFSWPLVGLVWFVTVLAQATGKSGHALFQAILTAAFFFGIAGAIFFIYTMDNEFKESRFAAGICIIIAAMGSVLVFRNQLKNA